MSSTLWTVIERRTLDGEVTVQSPTFPSRIIQPDKMNSAVFTGVEIGNILCGDQAGAYEYRLLWRTVSDPDDTSPKQLVAVPLGKNVTFTYSHGSASILLLALAGVDVVLDFNLSSRVLSTSWFIPPFITSWTLGMPKRVLANLITGAWNSVTAPLLIEEPVTSSLMEILCCRKSKA